MASSARQGGGRIIQVSSAGGQTTYPNFSLYHCSKWGIEGLIEAVRKEVVPFHIEFTIAEPGATMTKFGEGLVSPPPMPEYEHTPAGDVRRAVAARAFPIPGDAAKMVNAIIASTETTPAPRRLAMGSDTYRDVRADLASRLAELDAQKELALSTDVIRTA